MLGGPLERSGFPPPSGDSDRRPVVYFCSAVLNRPPGAPQSDQQISHPIENRLSKGDALERIKRQLDRLPPTHTERSVLRLSYYIEVYGRLPETDQVQGFDVHNGPVPSRISDLAMVPYGQDSPARLDFWGSDVGNPATEGDTRWVNYSMRRFSSRSMAS